MAEIQCWGLWDLDNGNNIDPKSFNLSRKLLEDLDTWSSQFDKTYDLEAHNFHLNIGFDTEQDEDSFYNEGWILLSKLKAELPNIEWWYRDRRFPSVIKEKPANKSRM